MRSGVYFLFEAGARCVPQRIRSASLLQSVRRRANLEERGAAHAWARLDNKWPRCKVRAAGAHGVTGAADIFAKTLILRTREVLSASVGFQGRALANMNLRLMQSGRRYAILKELAARGECAFTSVPSQWRLSRSERRFGLAVSIATSPQLWSPRARLLQVLPLHSLDMRPPQRRP